MFFLASGSDYTRQLRLCLEDVASRPIKLEASLMALKKKKQEMLEVGGWRLKVECWSLTRRTVMESPIWR
jgi:hypothetical protein